MNEIIQRVLDLPGQITARVLGTRVSDTLNKFDSGKGIRSYFQTIYSWLSLGMTILMIWELVDGINDHFSSADTMGIIGSVITTLICLIAAFAIPNVIRIRGEELVGKHTGMVQFLAHDVMKTNIRLMGELSALVVFTQALCMVVATLFNATVYAPLAGGEEIASMLSGIYSWFTGVAGENIPFDFMGAATSFANPADWNASISGSWTWDSVMGTLGMLVNAILLLASYYVILSIYSVAYNITAWLVGWIQKPNLPIKMH
tara:strand:+ start:1959 stop:2738 length:780 start_codon:yes stop_codon:yes gene_type:complete